MRFTTNEFLGIYVTIERRFTLKCVRDMIRTYSHVKLSKLKEIQATLLFFVALTQNSSCLINNPMSLFAFMADLKVSNSSQVSNCPLGKIRTFMYDYFSLSNVSYAN